ncbi:MAG: DUF433 domain-containing protein [Alphaproteobacteria bacterium]|nr:DUF433 domain-containing protein [Alphaproteobacteria bacterium]
MSDYKARIQIDPAIMAGKPVIRGTRIPVDRILAELGHGVGETELLVMYPRLTAEDIRAAQLYAAAILSNQEVLAH